MGLLDFLLLTPVLNVIVFLGVAGGLTYLFSKAIDITLNVTTCGYALTKKTPSPREVLDV